VRRPGGTSSCNEFERLATDGEGSILGRFLDLFPTKKTPVQKLGPVILKAIVVLEYEFNFEKEREMINSDRRHAEIIKSLLGREKTLLLVNDLFTNIVSFTDECTAVHNQKSTTQLNITVYLFLALNLVGSGGMNLTNPRRGQITVDDGIALLKLPSLKL
jgi:hypothetical protein